MVNIKTLEAKRAAATKVWVSVKAAIEKFHRTHHKILRDRDPALPKLPGPNTTMVAEWWLYEAPRRATTLGGATLGGALAHDIAMAAQGAGRNIATIGSVIHLLGEMHKFGVDYGDGPAGTILHMRCR